MTHTLNKIYHHKYFPRFFYKKPDGGKDSGVTGYFLIEWKWLFSIGILKFNKGTREAFHNHAFNAVTFWISGDVEEIMIDGDVNEFCGPSVKSKYTPRNCYHKVRAIKTTYALTFRGPWNDTWNETKDNKEITLTHGRNVL